MSQEEAQIKLCNLLEIELVGHVICGTYSVVLPFLVIVWQM